MPTHRWTLLDQVRYIANMETDACVEWQGATNDLGYPYIKWRGRTVPVRRMVYGIYMDGPTAAPHRGSRLFTTCKNKLCVNPLHMTEGK